MTAVIIHSDFGAQESKVCGRLHFPPSICYEVVAMILVFLMLSFKQNTDPKGKKRVTANGSAEKVSPSFSLTHLMELVSILPSQKFLNCPHTYICKEV